MLHVSHPPPYIPPHDSSSSSPNSIYTLFKHDFIIPHRQYSFSYNDSYTLPCWISGYISSRYVVMAWNRLGRLSFLPSWNLNFQSIRKLVFVELYADKPNSILSFHFLLLICNKSYSHSILTKLLTSVQLELTVFPIWAEVHRTVGESLFVDAFIFLDISVMTAILSL